MRKIRKITENIWFFIPLVIALLLIPIPIEDFLSEYPFLRSFQWYIYWIGAFISLLIWLVTGIMYSFNEKKTEKLLWGSLFSFLFFHYLTLFTIFINGYKIQLYPFIYTISNISNKFYTSYLDTGQILFLLTLIFSEKTKNILYKIKNNLF